MQQSGASVNKYVILIYHTKYSHTKVSSLECSVKNTHEFIANAYNTPIYTFHTLYHIYATKTPGLISKGHVQLDINMLK